MKTLRSLIQLSIVAVLCMGIISSPNSVTAQETTGTIQGRILDQNGNPFVSNTYVYAVPPGTGAFSNAGWYHFVFGLDPDGSYSISNLTPGDYIIGACTQDYICGYYGGTRFIDEATVVSLSAGDIISNINFTLDTSGSYSGNPGTIQGYLFDKYGYPARHGGVTAIPTGAQSSPYYSLTNEDGFYSIGDLIPGSYIIMGGVYGYANGYYGGDRYITSATAVSVYPGETLSNIDITLLDLVGTISGTVFDQDTQPLAGEYILISSYDNNWQVGYTGVTKPDGSYTMEGVPTGEYRVCVYDQSGKFFSQYYSGIDCGDALYGDTPPGTTPVEVNAPYPTEHIDFHMQPIGSISGQVLFPGGSPVSGVRVFAELNDGTIVLNTLTDSNGNFTITPLHTNSYILQIDNPPSGYFSMYYGQVQDRNSATLISLINQPNRNGFVLTLIPIPTAAGLYQLVASAPASSIASNTQKSLLAKLDNAIDSIKKGKNQAAKGQLNAFINEVQAQRGKKIATTTADILIDYANKVIANLS